MILGDVHIESTPSTPSTPSTRSTSFKDTATQFKSHHVFGFPQLLTAYRMTYRGSCVGGAVDTVLALLSVKKGT